MRGIIALLLNLFIFAVAIATGFVLLIWIAAIAGVAVLYVLVRQKFWPRRTVHSSGGVTIIETEYKRLD